MSVNYRKLYKQIHGSIPVDENGRTFDIHHIDGNRNNNDISNLIAVSLAEHYEIHERQNDKAACLRLAARMNMSPEKMSELSRESNLSRVKDGTHPFLGPSMNKKRIDAGTHNWLDGNRAREFQLQRLRDGVHSFYGKGDIVRQRNLERVANDTFHMCKPDNPMRKAVENGTHNFITNNPAKKGEEHHMKRPDNHVVKMVKEGTHNFCGGNLQRKMMADGKHPCLTNAKCPYCNREGKTASMGMHIRTCKLNPNRVPIVRETLLCPHCERSINTSAYKKYHGDNCKMKH